MGLALRCRTPSFRMAAPQPLDPPHAPPHAPSQDQPPGPPPGLPLKQQPVRLFMAGGALMCVLATVVLLLQPQPQLLVLHRQLAAGSALAALAFWWFSRAESRLGMPDRVLLAAMAGIALVVVLAWQLGTGLRTIVLGIVPLLVGLTVLLAGGWRAALVTAVGAGGIGALAMVSHQAGPEALAQALTRLTLASGVWAHVVLLLGGLVFGVAARILAQRWRGLAEERERQFRELLASAADRYVELDADLRFAHPSIELPSARGPLPAEFVGHHPWDTPGLMMEPEVALRHRADLLARRPFQVEVSSAAGPGRPLERLLLNGRPRYSSQGQFLGYWCAGRDITAQQHQREAAARAAAEAEAASRAKSSFLANMSHEVRTPLNGILGLARLARQHVDERERLVEYLDLIGRSASALHATLSDVLDLSRAEARQLTVTLQPLALPPLLHELHRVHEALCRERGLACTLSLPPDVPPWVLTDGGRLRQILTNFLHNALKFTRAGGIGIEVLRLPDGRWRLAVHDTGPGIAEADLPRLFSPFQQLDGNTTPAGGGSGLGLSICRQLARALGGEVGVSSTPGQGSRFWADLPLPPTPAPPAATETPPPRPLHGRRALVVEDNPVNMLITVATLQGWGLQVAQAIDGHAALALLDNERAAGRGFDIVLMDLQMPGLDGLAATRALRQRGLAMPVVALTATVRDDARAQALEAGIAEVMSKPIESEQLRAVLERLVGG